MRIRHLILLCTFWHGFAGCSAGPSGYIYPADGQDAVKTDFSKTGNNALIQYKGVDAGYMATWGIISYQVISVRYTNNSNIAIKINPADFKIVKNNVPVKIYASSHSSNRNKQGIYKKILNEWNLYDDPTSKPPVYVIPPKSTHGVLIHFEKWGEANAPGSGDTVYLDIPIDDKVFHIKSYLD
jgi:hypothetical protein